MKAELKNEYDTEEKVNIALVCSTPLHKEKSECEEMDLLKMVYVENTVDETGFVTLQIQTYSLNDETQSIVVYGKNMNGIAEVRVHELGYRLYPHLTIVDGIHAGVEGIQAWENDGGVENFLEALTAHGLIGNEEE